MEFANCFHSNYSAKILAKSCLQKIGASMWDIQENVNKLLKVKSYAKYYATKIKKNIILEPQLCYGKSNYAEVKVSGSKHRFSD